MDEERFVVRFLNYAGDDLLGVVEIEYGGNALPLAPTPEIIQGKTFKGWNADITHVTEDMTVRPVYEDQTFTVRFLNYAGTDFLSVQTVKYGESATAPTPEVIEGKIFLNWSTDFTNVTSNLTIRPIYKTITFTVRFLDKEGDAVWSTQTVAYGGDALPPTALKYDDYIFIGWNSTYRNIHQDKTIRPIYRFVPKHPVLNFYSRNEDGTSGGLKKSYGMVNSCSIEEKLSGECAVTIKLLTRQTEGAVSIYDRLEIEGLVFYITEVKKNISSGMCYTEMSGEHISYILNDDEYKVTAYDKQGKPKEILQELLLGTPFSVGTVDFEDEVTLRVNNDATRRACVMQLIALVGGEIEYYGYTIGIRKHVGSSTPVDVMNNSNVQDISYSYNVSEDTTNYSLSLYQKGKLELGDELSLRFEPLGIEAESRIVGMEWNPLNFKDVSITVGQYIPTLNDSLYQIATDIQDITQTTAKYTVEFGEVIGNGSFYFTRAYRDRPYFMVQTDDGSKPVIELTKSEGSAFGEYIGAKLSGVSSTTVTLVVFYCTIPAEDEK